MSIVNLIEKISGKQRERQKTKETDFRKIVREIADAKEPDADRVESILHDVGKSLGELQAAVELLHSRRELRAKIDALPKLKTDRKRIENRIAALNKEFEEAEQRYDNELMPLEGELANLRSTISASEQAYSKLYDTCNDPELIARLAKVTNLLTEAIDLASTHRGAAEGFRLNARRENTLAEHAKKIIDGEAKVQELLDRAKEFERKSADSAAELAKVEKTIAELNRQQESIRELMLVP